MNIEESDMQGKVPGNESYGVGNDWLEKKGSYVKQKLVGSIVLGENSQSSQN